MKNAYEDNGKTHSKVMGSSTAERRFECTRSYYLELTMPNRSSAAAAEGDMLHDVTEQVIRDDVTPESLLGFQKGEHTYTRSLMNEMVKPAADAFDELLDAYNISDYELMTEVTVGFPGTEAFGTIDVLLANDKYVINLDWKFGRGVKVAAGPENIQCKFGLAAGRIDPKTADMFPGRQMVGAIIQPAMSEPLTHGIIGPETISAFERKVYHTLDVIQSGEENTTLKVGTKWCQFCNAKSVCPAQTEAAVRSAQEIIDPNRIDPDRLGELLTLSYQVKSWANNIQAVAQAELEVGAPVTGYKLVAGRRTRDWVSEDAALYELQELGVPEIDAYTEPKLVSPAQAEKLLKSRGHNPKLLADVIQTHQGSTSMVPEDDPREPVHKGSALHAALNLPV